MTRFFVIGSLQILCEVAIYPLSVIYKREFRIQSYIISSPKSTDRVGSYKPLWNSNESVFRKKTHISKLSYSQNILFKSEFCRIFLLVLGFRINIFEINIISLFYTVVQLSRVEVYFRNCNFLFRNSCRINFMKFFPSRSSAFDF